MNPTIHDPVLLRNRIQTVHSPVIITSPAVAPTPTRRWWASLPAIAAIVLVGIGLRTIALAGDRNLWIDESMLALNLVERSPAQLFKPLDWNQGAPVGFLLLVKGAILSIGASEVGLRIVPFIGSILGLIAMAWVSVRLLPRPAAVLAILLAAMSPFLISYAAECKQYATDAAITVGLLAVGLGLLQGERGFARWAALAAAGAGAVWFSHPAAFVLGGIGTALLAEAALARDRGRFLAAAGTVATWLASFAVCYLVNLRQLSNNNFLLSYWDGHFLPLPPTSPGDFAWLLDHYFAPFAYPGGLGGTEIRAGGIAAVLFIIGIWGMWKARWPVAVAVVLPAVLALLASGLNRYPFAGRLLLFLVPLMLLGVAHGAWMIATALRTTVPFAAYAFVGVLVAAPCLEAYQEIRRPMRQEQIEPVLAQLRADWRPGDRIYVYYGARPAFTVYTRDNPFPAGAVVYGESARDRRLSYRDELAKLRGQVRVWLVFSHPHHNESEIITAFADGLGRCEGVYAEEGAMACLYNFTAPPGSAAGPDPALTLPRDENRAAITRGGDR